MQIIPVLILSILLFSSAVLSNDHEDSLKEIDMFHDEGFNYYPSPSNKNVNSAFQLIDFNGKDFVRSGVLTIDSLNIVKVQNP